MKAIERTGVDYYCQVTDVELIQEIVRGLPDNPLCINIGAGMGTSALAMLEARVDSRVISIDISEECLNEERKLIINSGVSGINNGTLDRERVYATLLGESQFVGRGQEKESVDFVFVDGGHKWEECFEDAYVWYDALKPNGIMAFHDYESPIQVLESVKRAVDDVVKVLQLEFVTKRGTLIVFRKVENERNS